MADRKLRVAARAFVMAEADTVKVASGDPHTQATFETRLNDALDDLESEAIAYTMRLLTRATRRVRDEEGKG